MPKPQRKKLSSLNFHPAVPILRVKDLEKSLDYYLRVLGFLKDWEGPSMASVSRGRASIMLCEGDQGNPRTWVWIGVGDAEELHREYAGKGATVRLPPTNYPWAYEMHIEDPDGHVLRFGSERKTDRPISEWVFWYRETP